MPSKISHRLAASFEHDMAQRHEVSDQDIHFSRLSGMSPLDIDVLCDFTREEALLVVIRCPKRPARYFHGKFQPKPAHVKRKSDAATGLATENGITYVSDYDLMSVWRLAGLGHYEKIVFQAVSEKDPQLFGPEANALMKKLDGRLLSAFQHGAQDDYNSAENPNVAMASTAGKLVDRFMVFNVGTPTYACNGLELQKIYERLLGRDIWPYDADGSYRYGIHGHA